MNPRLSNHDLLQNGEMLQTGGYSPGDINGTRPEVVERRSAHTADLLLSLWRERRFIVKALVVGMAVAAVVSLLIPPKYESTTRIMPPDKQGLGGLAAMLATAGEDRAGSLVGGIVSDAVGLKSSGALYAGILRSNTVQDAVIDRFDLRRVYNVRYQKDARERLSDNTDINEDRKSGIMTITTTDRSRQRVAEIAKFYVDTLDSLTTQLNTSAAHRERLFIEDRLKTVKQDLDLASKNLSDFSSKNLTLDVKDQGKAMVDSVAALEGELIAAESQLSGLEQIYAPNNVRVRSLQARISALKGKLSQLRGTGDDSTNPNPTTNTDDFNVSISKLPALGVTYYDLYRQVRIQETVFEILTKQNELAKIEEAKEVPTIKVLDEAKVPEIKSSPKRTLITLLGGILASVLAAVYVITLVQFRALGASHPLSLFGLEVRAGLSEDVLFIRDHIPQPILRVMARMRSRVSTETSVSPPMP